MTPGTYLRMRREAAGLTIADVAAAIQTTPPTPEWMRAEWIGLIEKDSMPAGTGTLTALREAFPFCLTVLERLSDLHYCGGGDILPAPRLCRACACSEFDPCDEGGQGCAWASPDLCTACTPDQPDDDPDGDRERPDDHDDDPDGAGALPVPSNDRAAPGLAA